MTLQSIVGGGGARLAVRRSGTMDAPPVVLLHGWAQSGAVWDRQVGDPALSEHYRLIAVDLRGHGASDAPPEGYDDPALWAADVAAVLADLDRPAVLVGWSYGGVVIADYLRKHGSARLAGIVLVGAVTELGRDRPGGRIGPVMRAPLPAALSEDPEVAVPALQTFIAGMADTALAGELTQRLLGYALQTPPRVRSALFRRDVSSAELLAGLDLPALVVHGAADAVVDPATGAHHARIIPGAEHVVLDGVGHVPFAEVPEEFNRALVEFLARCCRPVGRVGS